MKPKPFEMLYKCFKLKIAWDEKTKSYVCNNSFIYSYAETLEEVIFNIQEAMDGWLSRAGEFETKCQE